MYICKIPVYENKFVDLQDKLNEAVKANTEIDIKQLTDFDWDKCYVFTAYYPPEAIYEDVGVEWTTIRTFIGFLLFHDSENEITGEDQFILVFKKGNRVVMSEFCRLSYLPANFNDNYKFTSNNAKFIETDSEYSKGIQELVLKE